MGRKWGDSDGYESTHISMFAVVTHLTDLSADYPVKMDLPERSKRLTL